MRSLLDKPVLLNELLLAIISFLLVACNKHFQTTVSNEITSLPSTQKTIADMENVANWQIPRLSKLDYLTSGRSQSEHTTRWLQATFYIGLTELAQRSINPFYADWIGIAGTREKWNIGYRPVFADDQLIGQTWIWYYTRYKNRTDVLAPIVKQFDSIVQNPPTNSLKFIERHDEKRMNSCQNRWCWADALFMAPPTWFALSKATGNLNYAHYADKEFRATYDLLYSKELHLMYRDSRFIHSKGEHGETIFWSRGTGWVYAGLVRILEFMPQDYAGRTFYETMFREMSAKLIILQKKDGYWPTSLLAGEKIKEPETSGTAFFTYGLAWGVHKGLLDETTYLPVALKGWAALKAALQPDGRLGWVQPVGASPDAVKKEDTHLYGTGGFLLAGSAIYDLAKKKELEALKLKRETYGRCVPERLDDFAWENDKVAFRIYGANTNVASTASGVDAWFKKVNYPIINKWYLDELNKTKSYHINTGEGYDAYHVGPTRGVGGTAVWINTKAYPAHSFKKYTILNNTKQEIRFEVEYEWDTPLGAVTERKEISLTMGSQLYKVSSSYTLNGKPTKLPIAIGLTTHDGKAKPEANAAKGRISTWETIDKLGVGTGVVIQPSKVKGITHQNEPVPDSNHIWLITETDPTGYLEFYAGFGWEGAGKIKTMGEWHDYLDTFLKQDR
jgi:rhamnogalacturonyl hydrolase YesR